MMRNRWIAILRAGSNGHPIEIVALHLTSLQRHRKSPIVRGQLADGSVVAPLKEMANPLPIERPTLIRAQLAGRMPHNGEAAFFASVENWLDANVAQFKDWSGDYTTPHVKQAVSTLLGR